jgi:glycerol-3-phosphate acyltransferase PlsY
MSATILVAKLVVAYLLGSLSGSLLLGRLRGVDIRELGSGNAGGTNALRTQGWLFAAGVVAIDVGKGALAPALVWLPPHASAPQPLAQALAFGFAATLGHVFPLYYGFRGGKGAATAVGALAVTVPGALVAPLLVWFVVLGLTGYVGLATVAAALALPPAMLPFLLAGNWSSLLGWALAYAALIVFTHRANLARVRAGTELRFERARVLARVLGLDRRP